MNCEYSSQCNESPVPSQRFSSGAYWITAADGKRESWYMYRKAFSLPRTDIRRAMLLSTSCFYHEVYLNGAFVCRGPARSYEFDKYFDVLDVSGKLNEGENVLAVLSPMFEMPYSYMPDPPYKGVICELAVETASDVSYCISTDSTWKVRKHDAFAEGTARYAIPLGPEEQYDARRELPNWVNPGYDDSGWSNALVIGPAGTHPWTGMRMNTQLPLTSDMVCAKKLISLELAEKPMGRNFRLGLANDGISVFMTLLHADEPASARLRFTTPCAAAAINGRPVDLEQNIQLCAGTNFLAFCQLHYIAIEPEFILETESKLTFTSGLFEGAEWSLYAIPSVTLAYPWHEKSGDLLSTNMDVKTLLESDSLASIPERLRAGFVPASTMEPSSYHTVVSQKCYVPNGGFTDSKIDEAQPRKHIGYTVHAVAHNWQALLPDGCGICTLEPQDGMATHFILDFGSETVGHVELDADAPEGTVFDVQGFELIDGNGMEWMQNHNGFRYVCREGNQLFTSHYRRGFRYLSVTVSNFNRPVILSGVRCIQTAYPVEEIGSFECSDQIINSIYRISLDTAKVCMLDSYVDCPGHEQSVWVGDARITALINMINFGAARYNQSFIRMIGESLCDEWVRLYRPDDDRYTSGLYLPVAAFPNYPEGGLPAWTFQWMLQAWEHYFFGGNHEDLSENFAFIVETLRRCRLRTNSRGMLDIPGAWNLIDWGNNDLAPYGEVTANNALLALCFRRAAQMAEALGRAEQARDYSLEAENRCDAVNRYCWDENRRAYVDTVRDAWAYGVYADFAVEKGMKPMDLDSYMACTRVSVQSNALALLCGCVPEDRLADVEKIIRDAAYGRYVSGAPSNRSVGKPPEEEAPGGIVAVGSPFFLFFLLDALYQTGNAELALSVIRRDWGDMIACGTTTCWETFKYNESHWTRSVAHAWSAAPAIYLPLEVLGVKPVEPGYRKFSIEPRPAGLSWAQGAVATPFGPITVRWRQRDDGTFDLHWHAPEQCQRV